MSVVAVVLLFVVWRMTKDWQRAALAVSLICGLFLSYGHVVQPIAERFDSINRTLWQYGILALWGGILISGLYLIRRARQTESATQFLNSMAIVLMALSLYNAMSFYVRESNQSAARQPATRDAIEAPIGLDTNGLPDIYYIIVDGYGRADMLQTVYGYDNTSFIHFLEDRGFFVASQSRANYNRTALSLSSSLNLEYINYMAEIEGEKSTNYGAFDELIIHSRLRDFLEKVGYETVVISSGYQSTELKDADQYISSQASFGNEFERLLLLQTPLAVSPGFGRYLSYEAHRNRVHFALEELRVLAGQSNARPRFIFAHVISPHPPFVFGPDGEEINPDRHYYLGDANDYQGTQSEYLERYPQQLNYLNKLLEDTLTHILDNALIPPVIVIQGDHGPGAFSDFRSIEDSCLYERMSIFNAYYAPQIDENALYESITPVNTFRVILDTYVGTNLGMLEDRVYFGSMPYLFDVQDITDAISDTPCKRP